MKKYIAHFRTRYPGLLGCIIFLSIITILFLTMQLELYNLLRFIGISIVGLVVYYLRESLK
jgi:hypothetical protein